MSINSPMREIPYQYIHIQPHLGRQLGLSLIHRRSHCSVYPFDWWLRSRFNTNIFARYHQFAWLFSWSWIRKIFVAPKHKIVMWRLKKNTPVQSIAMLWASSIVPAVHFSPLNDHRKCEYERWLLPCCVRFTLTVCVFASLVFSPFRFDICIQHFYRKISA